MRGAMINDGQSFLPHCIRISETEETHNIMTQARKLSLRLENMIIYVSQSEFVCVQCTLGYLYKVQFNGNFTCQFILFPKLSIFVVKLVSDY